VKNHTRGDDRLNYRAIMHRALQCCIPIWLCLLSLPARSATLDSQVTVKIAAQPLENALLQLAEQASLQLVLNPRIVKSRRAQALAGKMSIREALDRLLRNTGLGYQWSGDHTVTIAPPADFRAASEEGLSGAPDVSSGSSSHADPRERGFAGSAGAAGNAPADPPGDSQASVGRLQEVIVTAQKRRQRAFDVPISLVVYDSEELAKRRITDLENLQYYVPGLWVQDTGTQRRIVLQGISNVYGNGPLVGEYLDEADITPEVFAGSYGFGQLDPSMYDLQRVEVLRGPQGTLYGEGSMGGTIRFITNKPVLDQFQMSSEVSASFTEYGAPSQSIDMMLNVPLIQDQLGLRLAGESAHEGGWIDQPAANVKNFNSQNRVDTRIEALWTPTEDFRLNATEVIHRNAFGPNAGEDAQGNYTQVFNQTATPSGEDNYDMSNLTGTYGFDGIQLLSSTTYFSVGANEQNEGLFEALGPLIYDVLIPSFPVSSRDFSQEFRLARTGGGPWQWTLGGFFKHFTDHSDESYYFGAPVSPGTPLSTVPFGSFDERDTSKSWSAFGDTSYKLLGRLTLGGGVRVFRDHESEVDSYDALQRATFASTDPRVYVQYQLDPNLNTYASAAKGFRSGGFNSYGLPQYQPESVWTYQLGMKSRLLEGRLRVDGDVYLSHYANYVVVGVTPFNPTVSLSSNAGNVRIRGIEGEVTWRLSNEWALSFNGDYTDAKIVSVSLLDAPYAVGAEAPGVPKYMFTTAAERDFSWNGRPAFARLDYSQTGPQSGRDIAGNPLFYSDVIRMLGFNTGLWWNDNLKLGLFAQNLLNDRGHLDWNYDEGNGARPRPRTFGIDFAVDFGR